jgi:hypothetical protein
MKRSRQEKHLEASKIFNMIPHCKSEDDLERVSDLLDECMLAGHIFKKDYKFLCEELDDRLMTLVEEGVI